MLNPQWGSSGGASGCQFSRNIRPIHGHSSRADGPYVVADCASARPEDTAAALFGACVGFLWFNREPARMYLGDTGSMFGHSPAPVAKAASSSTRWYG